MVGWGKENRRALTTHRGAQLNRAGRKEISLRLVVKLLGTDSFGGLRRFRERCKQRRCLRDENEGLSRWQATSPNSEKRGDSREMVCLQRGEDNLAERDEDVAKRGGEQSCREREAGG